MLSYQTKLQDQSSMVAAMRLDILKIDNPIKEKEKLEEAKTITKEIIKNIEALIENLKIAKKTEISEPLSYSVSE